MGKPFDRVLLSLLWCLTVSWRHVCLGKFTRKSDHELSVRNIPKFKDRANWSRDTFQPMRRRACVYQQTNQNITPVIKNFQNNGLPLFGEDQRPDA